MKKVITLTALVGLLVFSVATSTFAVTIYTDVMMDGTYKTGSDKKDAGQSVFGVEIPFCERHLIIVEGLGEGYNDNKGEQGELDLMSTLTKYGYELIPGDAFQLYGTISALNMNGDFEIDEAETYDMEYTPLLLGVAVKYHINERMYLNGILDYAVCHKDYEMENNEDADADYMAARVKLNYFFTEKFGARLGYNWSQLKIKDDGTTKDTINGYTIGLIYQF